MQFRVWFLLVIATGLAQAAEVESLRLIPFPKVIQWQPDPFLLEPPLLLEVSGASRAVFARLLNDELERAGLKPARVRSLEAPCPAFRLAPQRGALHLPSLPAEDMVESYALEVRATGIVGAAPAPAGLGYALQTLRQLIRANRRGSMVPGLTIQDWPSLRWRGFQDDLTRGPSSTLETLKFETALGAYLKLNLMTYYMEYQFAFRKHPNIGPPDGSLTPREVTAWVDYAHPLHVDILGNQQSFGHFGWILKHPEYAPLQETAEVLTPVREETYAFLDDLYSEICPRLPFPWFNVCCDETWGLGTGPSKELAASIGVGGVYVRHLRRIHELLRDRHHKRMMMWGDIILQHPDRLAEIPQDTIMLTWGYDARPSYESQILPFARSGYAFFVCPGVNNWSRILPDVGVAATNIQHFVRDGARHGALGMINTDWEDDGEAINAVKWHADAWAAECAWNASTTPLAIFNRRVGAVLFGEAGDHFGQAVELLAQTHRLPAMNGMFNSRFWQRDFIVQTNPPAMRLAATDLLAVVQPALQHLEACRQEARHNRHLLDAYDFGARRMEMIGRRMLDGLEAAGRYAEVYAAAARSSPAARALPADALGQLARVEQLVRQNRDAHEALGRQFAALWLAENKPYALDWTLQRYAGIVRDYEILLAKLAQARAAAVAGRPLPPPAEMGWSAP